MKFNIKPIIYKLLLHLKDNEVFKVVFNLKIKIKILVTIVKKALRKRSRPKGFNFWGKLV
jgi:hypothetical protein